jgi:multiple sugar transport system permease protein
MKDKRTYLKFVKLTLVYFGLLLALLYALIPIYWMVSTAFKYPKDILVSPPRWVFSELTLANIALVLKVGFPQSATNSLIIATGSTVLAVGLGFLAAYSFARFEFKGKNNLKFWILSQRFLPPVVVAVPFYLMIAFLHMIDTHIAVILAHLSYNLPFSIWMMEGFIADIPSDLDESATVDGCSRLGAIWRVVFPLAIPGIAVTAIFAFVFSWNELLFALLLTRVRASTIPIMLGEFSTTRGVEWQNIMALSLLSTIPVIIFAAAIQRYIVRGMTLGAVKG